MDSNIWLMKNNIYIKKNPDLFELNFSLNVPLTVSAWYKNMATSISTLQHSYSTVFKLRITQEEEGTLFH